jgi:hypothetical protein
MTEGLLIWPELTLCSKKRRIKPKFESQTLNATFIAESLTF